MKQKGKQGALGSRGALGECAWAQGVAWPVATHACTSAQPLHACLAEHSSRQGQYPMYSPAPAWGARFKHRLPAPAAAAGTGQRGAAHLLAQHLRQVLCVHAACPHQPPRQHDLAGRGPPAQHRRLAQLQVAGHRHHAPADTEPWRGGQDQRWHHQREGGKGQHPTGVQGERREGVRLHKSPSGACHDTSHGQLLCAGTATPASGLLCWRPRLHAALGSGCAHLISSPTPCLTIVSATLSADEACWNTMFARVLMRATWSSWYTQLQGVVGALVVGRTHGTAWQGVAWHGIQLLAWHAVARHA